MNAASNLVFNKILIFFDKKNEEEFFVSAYH
jgi:hypothetical protein